jgi:hypothetical protein
MNTEIARAKATFLARYNPSRLEKLALTSGLNAALRHNPLYGPEAQRRLVRSSWKERLSLGLVTLSWVPDPI